MMQFLQYWQLGSSCKKDQSRTSQHACYTDGVHTMPCLLWLSQLKIHDMMSFPTP